MPKHSTDLSPLHLAYSANAVLLTKIMTPTLRSMAIRIEDTSQTISQDEDLIDETQEDAVQHILKY